MGQYFNAVVLAPQREDKVEILAAFKAWDYENGVKQMEHSWIGNYYVETVERLFTPNGEFYKHRLVWAGDYGDFEPGYNNNLYYQADEYLRRGKCKKLDKSFHYLVNHSKHEFVDKTKLPKNAHGWQVHPLPLLTAAGNEGAGGEYPQNYPDAHLLGRWARDIISVEKEIPSNYQELNVGFLCD